MVVIKLIYLSVGILLLLNAIYLYFVANFNLGLLSQFLLSGVFIFYSLLFERIQSVDFIPILIYIMTFFFILFCLSVFLYGRNNNVEYNEDAVIVLGAGIRGETVSASLAKRLDVAVEYHAKNPKALIIVSGGQGKQECISEALAMERYLISKGIRKSAIVKEDRSTSTVENFSYSAQILNEKIFGASKIAFISNDFHIFRSEQIAKSFGLDVRHLSSDTPWFTVPMTYLRELIAYIDYYFL